MLDTTLTFIHAADLHLGAPFRGLDNEAAFLKQSLTKATYKALDRLVEVCLSVKPQALLLAGDLYNPEATALKSLNALHRAFCRLGEAGIAVFIVYGNHDPADVQPSWTWPENVHVFDATQVQSVGLRYTQPGTAATRLFEVLDPSMHNSFNSDSYQAVIHGISHLSSAVIDNLAKKISQVSTQIKSKIPTGAYQVGLLHCAVSGSPDLLPNASLNFKTLPGRHKPYAPCSIDDLACGAVDYWALGHIHKQAKVVKRPLAFYSGNTQGLHINETGSKGCLLIRMHTGTDADISFIPLAPIEWRKIDYEIGAETSLSALQTDLFARIRQELRSQEQEVAVRSRSGYGLEGLVVRLVISGRTALHGYLHKEKDSLIAWLREQLQNSTGRDQFIWLKDVKIETRPLMDMEAGRHRDDLVGETLRRLDAARQDPALLDKLLGNIKTPLGQMFSSPAARRSGLLPPDEVELSDLLDEAAWLCLELLAPADESIIAEGEEEGQ